MTPVELVAEWFLDKQWHGGITTNWRFPYGVKGYRFYGSSVRADFYVENMTLWLWKDVAAPLGWETGLIYHKFDLRDPEIFNKIEKLLEI